MFIKVKNKLRFTDEDSLETQTTLESKVYNMEVIKHDSMFGSHVETYLTENNLYKKALKIEKGIFGEIRDHITNFFSDEMKEIKNQMCMTNKLGLIFKGAPGTGKTFLAGQIAQELCDSKNAVGILTTGYRHLNLNDIVEDIRKHDNEERLVVLIMDEFEKGGDKNNSDFLSFMDGKNSKDNILIIATVNSTKNLPETLMERPGRFEKIYDFKTNNKEVVEATVINIIPESYKDKIDIINLVEDLIDKNRTTIDYIRIKVRDVLFELLRKEKYKFIPKPQVQLAG